MHMYTHTHTLQSTLSNLHFVYVRAHSCLVTLGGVLMSLVNQPIRPLRQNPAVIGWLGAMAVWRWEWRGVDGGIFSSSSHHLCLLDSQTHFSFSFSSPCPLLNAGPTLQFAGWILTTVSQCFHGAKPWVESALEQDINVGLCHASPFPDLFWEGMDF